MHAVNLLGFMFPLQPQMNCCLSWMSRRLVVMKLTL